MDKIKAYLYALLVGFLNPYPSRVAGAVAVLVVLANFTGMLAALRKGEKVSGSKIARGHMRIILYFVSFSALYHALQAGIFQHLLSAVYSVIALHEFFLFMQKAVEAKLIPRALLQKLQSLYAKSATNSNNSPAP